MPNYRGVYGMLAGTMIVLALAWGCKEYGPASEVSE